MRSRACWGQQRVGTWCSPLATKLRAEVAANKQPCLARLYWYSGIRLCAKSEFYVRIDLKTGFCVGFSQAFAFGPGWPEGLSQRTHCHTSEWDDQVRAMVEHTVGCKHVAPLALGRTDPFSLAFPPISSWQESGAGWAQTYLLDWP